MSWDPQQHVSETVTFRGMACDARAGAIVLLPDETPVYIAGLTSWDDTHSGNEVEVTGRLEHKPSRIPKIPPGGEQYHGLGETFVLEDASWTVVALTPAWKYAGLAASSLHVDEDGLNHQTVVDEILVGLPLTGVV